MAMNSDPFIFFRPGELTLLLETSDQALIAGRDTLEPTDLKAVDARLEAIGIILHTPAPGDPPRFLPLVLRRMYGDATGVLTATTRILHTVRLQHWRSEDQRALLSVADEYQGTRVAVNDVSAAANVLAGDGFNAAAGGTDFLLHSWSPNWLAAPFGQCSFGSPGGTPQPLLPMNSAPTFRLDAGGQDPVTAAVADLANGVSLPHGHGDRGRGVLVAVLDTWPMNDLATLQGTNTPLGNVALGQAVAGALVQSVRTYGVGPAQRVSLHNRHRRTDGVVELAYDESNHGLFVAGIVSDLAPEADIIIYQVLNDAGIGDLMTVAGAVQDAMRNATERDSKLVLNLSLGVGMVGLLAERLLDRATAVYDSPGMVQDVIDALGPQGSQRTASSELDELVALHIVEQRGGKYRFMGMFESLDFLFAFQQQFLGAPETLVVAATGNNSDGSGFRFGPRIPAALEGVVAVSAIVPSAQQPDWVMAAYSNEDDLFPDNDGVGAFGGDVTVVAGVTVSGSGVKGLYAGQMMPSALLDWPGPPTAIAAQNTSGWATWSGTSFATPIVAGLAACVWSATGAPVNTVRSLIAPGPDTQVALLQFP